MYKQIFVNVQSLNNKIIAFETIVYENTLEQQQIFRNKVNSSPAAFSFTSSLSLTYYKLTLLKGSKMMYNPGYEKCDKCDKHEKHDKCEKREKQKHVHEVTGSTGFSEECKDCHNHRFCAVSGEAIHIGNTHIHEIKFRTDFADEHFHEFCGKSGPAVEVGNGKHVHFAKAFTDFEDGHKHRFQVASLIESPADFEYCD